MLPIKPPAKDLLNIIEVNKELKCTNFKINYLQLLNELLDDFKKIRLLNLMIKIQ